MIGKLGKLGELLRYFEGLPQELKFIRGFQGFFHGTSNKGKFKGQSFKQIHQNLENFIIDLTSQMKNINWRWKDHDLSVERQPEYKNIMEEIDLITELLRRTISDQKTQPHVAVDLTQFFDILNNFLEDLQKQLERLSLLFSDQKGKIEEDSFLEEKNELIFEFESITKEHKIEKADTLVGMFTSIIEMNPRTAKQEFNHIKKQIRKFWMRLSTSEEYYNAILHLLEKRVQYLQQRSILAREALFSPIYQLIELVIRFYPNDSKIESFITDTTFLLSIFQKINEKELMRQMFTEWITQTAEELELETKAKKLAQDPKKIEIQNLKKETIDKYSFSNFCNLLDTNDKEEAFTSFLANLDYSQVEKIVVMGIPKNLIPSFLKYHY